LLPVQGRWAAERWTLTQAPSLTYLAARPQAGRAGMPASLLSFGEGAATQREGQRWPALPYAQAEAHDAAMLFAAQGAIALTGPAASEEALRQQAREGGLGRVRILHIAAHGLLDRKRPERQALLLAPTGNSEETDGWVVTTDWLSYPLKTDLVILSACDAGSGPVQPGDGLGGFAMTLQLAGNRDLLASAWPVTDRPASALVLAVLRGMRQGLPVARALAASKRALLAEQGPFSIQARTAAAFVLVGQ
jgi:CHAT domain-containing protein